MNYVKKKRRSLNVTLKRYRHWFMVNFRSQFAYRGIIFENIFNYIMQLVLMLLLWKAIYNHTEIIHGRSYEQMVQYILASSTISSFFIYPSIHFLSMDIRNGEIAYSLLKPIDFQTLFIVKNLGRTAAVAVTIIPIYALMVFFLGVASDQGNILFAFVYTLLGILTCVSFDFVMGLICFWTENSWGVTFVRQIAIQYLSGGFIPFEFLPDTISTLLRDWSPFSGIIYFPVQILTQNYPDSYILFRMVIQILWCMIFLVIGRLLHNLASTKTVVNGG